MINWDEISSSFRAKDIRGIVGKNVYPDVIARAAAIFANIVEEKGGAKVLISGDGRTSSPMFVMATAAGVSSAGLEAHIFPILPINIANFGIYFYDFDGGAYVTASHNPPEWNGVRFRRPDGTGFTGENRIIKERFKKGEVRWASWEKVGSIVMRNEESVIKDYIRFVIEKVPPPNRELKILLDPRNGVAGIGIPELFSKYHKVSTINANIDGRFPNGHPDPVDTEIDSTARLVKNTGADFGIVFDGDADRGVLIDEEGRKVPAETIGIILAENLLKSGDKVIVNLECSSIIREKLEPLGIKVIDWIVGDVFISEKIKEVGAKLAIENSYHIFLPLYGINFDDVAMAEFVLSSILANSGKKMSQLSKEVGEFYVLRKNVEVPESKKWQIADKIREKLESKFSNVITLDGVKVYMEDSSVLIRPSNTEPLIRIIVDARSEEKAKQLLKEYEKFVTETVKSA